MTAALLVFIVAVLALCWLGAGLLLGAVRPRPLWPEVTRRPLLCHRCGMTFRYAQQFAWHGSQHAGEFLEES